MTHSGGDDADDERLYLFHLRRRRRLHHHHFAVKGKEIGVGMKKKAAFFSFWKISQKGI